MLDGWLTINIQLHSTEWTVRFSANKDQSPAQKSFFRTINKKKFFFDYRKNHFKKRSKTEHKADNFNTFSVFITYIQV